MHTNAYQRTINTDTHKHTTNTPMYTPMYTPTHINTLPTQIHTNTPLTLICTHQRISTHYQHRYTPRDPDNHLSHKLKLKLCQHPLFSYFSLLPFEGGPLGGSHQHDLFGSVTYCRNAINYDTARSNAN